MRKVLFVATVVKTHIMEFHLPYLKMFKEMGWETAVAARNDYDNPKDCQIPYCDTYFDIPFARNPLRHENWQAYSQLKKIIDEGGYDIIHCHTPVGAALTRLAAREARKKGTKVFYTAHGFHFYKGAPLANWLLFYPVERWLAHYTDVLITINKEDYNRAKSFKAKKVCYVPGVGIDLHKFNSDHVDRTEKRKAIGVQADSFLLLSVGEWIPKKNHEVVIKAMSELKKKGKLGQIEYVICGRGAYAEYLEALAEKLGMMDHIHFLGYGNDISDICKCADLFLFMSHQEGLPVALMEAMACGLPAICLNIRGNTDLIENNVTGLICENNPQTLAEKILNIQSQPAFRERLASAALVKIKHFDLTSAEGEMAKIYTGGKKLNELKRVYNKARIRAKLGIPLQATVLLSVGEVNLNKNHEIVIRALAKLKGANAYYVICGSGVLLQERKKFVESLGLRKQVIFTGYRNDVANFYELSDIFVFPSYREGLSAALMEAMASELPVICSDIRGNNDLVDNGKGGYRVSPSSVDQWVTAIKRMLAEKDRWHQYGEYNRDKIANSFGQELVLKKMKRIYDQYL